MNKNNAPYRPGLTAIAAVLALSSTSVLAQVTLPADPVAPAPAAVASTAPAAVPAPAAQAPVQTVQSVPATPALPDLPASDTASQPAPAHKAIVRDEARAAPARTAAKETPSASRAVEAPSAPKVAPATIQSDQPAAAPVERRHVTPIVPTDAMATDARPAPAPVATNAADQTNYAGWALLGGGALLVAGGAAFAMTRRPKRRDEAVYDETAARPVAVHPAPLPAEPEPVMRTPAPVMRQPVHDPVPTMNRDYAEMNGGDRRAALEAMIAEAPSEANPFHSRRNRLRRADFLLRTGQVEPRQGQYALAEERVSETASARADRWSETRVTGKQKPRFNWRPMRG